MSTAYEQRPGLHSPGRSGSNYDIKVTREVSVDSRPESRRRMQYTTFPPNANPQPRPRDNNQTNVSSDSPVRPFADFSFSNSNDVDSISNTLTGGGPRQKSSTLDLAQFLRSTSPPASRSNSPVPSSSRSSSIRRFGLGLLGRHSKHSSDASRASRASPEPPKPLQLPDSVVAKTAPNGKKYLEISVPVADSSENARSTGQTPTHQSPQNHHGSLAHALSLPALSDGVKVGESASSFGYRPPPVAPNDRLGTRAQRDVNVNPALDRESLDTYSSYLKSQAPPPSAQPAPKRVEPVQNKPMSNIGDAIDYRNTIQDMQPESYAGRPAPSSTMSDDYRPPTARSRAVSVVSETPSYRSVSIHSHGLPPRKSSSLTATPNPPESHVPSLPSVPPVRSSTSDSAGTQSSSAPVQPAPSTTSDRDRLPPPPPLHVDAQRLSNISSAPSIAESTSNMSDASSGIVMDAQMAHVNRAPAAVGTFNSRDARKPPRPGPAPTRALPSLPETQYDASTPRSLRSQGSSSPVRREIEVPSRLSDSREVVESPIIHAFAAPSIAHVVESTSKPSFDPPSRPTTAASTRTERTEIEHASPKMAPQEGPQEKAKAAAPTTKADPLMTAEALKLSRKSREERVRARKMRDLQSIRARAENKKLDDALGSASSDSNKENNSTRGVRASLASNSSSASSDGSRLSGRLSTTSASALRLSPVSANGGGRRISRDLRRNKNALSPILLVMEQEPMTGTYRTGAPAQPLETQPPLKPPTDHSPSIPSQSSPPTNGTPTPPRSPSPSFQSSDEDGLRHITNNPTPRNASPPKPTLYSPSHSQTLPNSSKAPTAAIAAAAPSPPLTSPTLSSKDAEFETRLQSMERKNAVLEAALMAMLQQNGFGSSPLPAGALTASTNNNSSSTGVAGQRSSTGSASTFSLTGTGGGGHRNSSRQAGERWSEISSGSGLVREVGVEGRASPLEALVRDVARRGGELGGVSE